MLVQFPKRQALENLWRGRLQEARLKLGQAQSRTKALQRADRGYAEAAHAENLALTEYRLVLHFFTELVLHGKEPDEDEWRKTTGA